MNSKYLISVITCLLLFLFSSCEKRINFRDIAFQDNKVCYEGKPFTGQIWTDDDSFGCFETEDGMMRSCTFYHDNGQVAIKMQIPEEKDSKGLENGDKNTAPVTQIFDEKGNTMDLLSFQQKYMPLWIKIAMVQGELINK